MDNHINIIFPYGIKQLQRVTQVSLDNLDFFESSLANNLLGDGGNPRPLKTDNLAGSFVLPEQITHDIRTNVPGATSN